MTDRLLPSRCHHQEQASCGGNRKLLIIQGLQQISLRWSEPCQMGIMIQSQRKWRPYSERAEWLECQRIHPTNSSRCQNEPRLCTDWRCERNWHNIINHHPEWFIRGAVGNIHRISIIYLSRCSIHNRRFHGKNSLHECSKSGVRSTALSASDCSLQSHGIDCRWVQVALHYYNSFSSPPSQLSAHQEDLKPYSMASGTHVGNWQEWNQGYGTEGLQRNDLYGGYGGGRGRWVAHTCIRTILSASPDIKDKAVEPTIVNLTILGQYEIIKVGSARTTIEGILVDGGLEGKK